MTMTKDEMERLGIDIGGPGEELLLHSDAAKNIVGEKWIYRIRHPFPWRVHSVEVSAINRETLTIKHDVTFSIKVKAPGFAIFSVAKGKVEYNFHWHPARGMVYSREYFEFLMPTPPLLPDEELEAVIVWEPHGGLTDREIHFTKITFTADGVTKRLDRVLDIGQDFQVEVAKEFNPEDIK